MAVTTPPSVTTLPTAPSTSSPSTFATLADAFIAALATFGTQLTALAANVFGNATDCATNASTVATNTALAAASATAAATAAAAAAWNVGTYALNTSAISQIDFQTYRKKTASSMTTVDPKNDQTNWALIGITPPAAYSMNYSLFGAL